MSEYQEKLFISHTIPPYQRDEVVTGLRSTVEDMAQYVRRRDTLIAHIQGTVVDETPQLASGYYVAADDLVVNLETLPAEPIIRDIGDVRIAPRIELHIVDTNESPLHHRRQINALATALGSFSMVIEDFPMVVATTYPELARFAHRCLGMRYAMATYYPANEHSQTALDDILRLGEEFRTLHKKAPSRNKQIESLWMPTDEFINRFTEPINVVS